MGKRGPKQQFTDVSCPNPECPEYRVAGRGNVVGNGTYTAGGETVRKFLCRKCGRTFNSRTGTVYEGLRTETGKVDAAFGMLAHGKSVSEAAEASGCSRSTVRRWAAQSDDDCLVFNPFGGKETMSEEKRPLILDDLPDTDFPKSLMYFPDKMAKCIKNMVSLYTWEIGLKPHHLPVIMEVGYRPHVSQRDLTDRLPVDKSRISMIVRELIDKDLLINESDSKIGSLVLTEKGHETYETCREISRETFSRIFIGFDSGEIDRLEEYVSRMNMRIDELSKEFSEKRDPSHGDGKES